MSHEEAALSTSDHERTQLLDLLRRKGADAVSGLSAEQQRVWLLQQMFPAAPFHVCVAVEVRGPLDAGALVDLAAASIDNHECLQSSFADLGRSPVRMLGRTGDIPFRTLDASEGADHFLDVARAALRDDASQPFNLRTPPLLRLTLVRRHRHHHALLVTMHQIVADVFSPELFAAEVLQRCADPLRRASRRTSTSFAAVVADERRRLQGEDYARRLDHWREALADVPALDLPSDVARPAVTTHNGAALTTVVAAPTAAALDALARREGLEIGDVLLTSFHVLLAWYAGQQDVAVGAIVNARDSALGRTIGPLANALVVRPALEGDPCFVDLLRQVARTSAAAHGRHNVPFAALVQDLQPARDLSRTPFFQASFLTLPNVFDGLTGSALSAEPLPIHPGITEFDIGLVVRHGERLRLSLEYNTDLYRSAMVHSMLANLDHVLDQVAANAETRLSALMTDVASGERAPIAVRLPPTDGARQPQTLHAAFEQQVRRSPHAIALCAEDRQLTYGALDAAAARTAALLAKHGVGAETRVAVCLEPSPDAILAILGTLKAGGAYVPLDPQVPPGRLEVILKDSGASVLLTRQSMAERLANAQARVLTIEQAAAEEPLPPRDAQHSRQLAYVIFTSGSTGRPKGVAVEHRSVMNNLRWRQATWPIGSGDRVLHNLAFTFDASVWATFWPLLNGACVILQPPRAMLDAGAVMQLVNEQRISILGGPPSLLSVLVDTNAARQCTSLRYVFSGGEALDGPLQQALHERLGCEVVNVYGPTEATVDCTYWQCPRDPDAKAAPIGRPIAGATAHVVNGGLNGNPPFVLGELCVGGVALARGYLGQPALTAEKFVPDPFATEPGGRMYRTGDLARYLEDGVLGFAGRKDEQIKLRGYRIELGEIERTLRRHPEVREAAVLVKAHRGVGAAQLVAYISRTPAGTAGRSLDALKQFLADHLPKYMIPDQIIELEALPHLTSGKLDKQALLALDSAAAPDEAPYRAPRDPLETEIAGIVSTALKLDRVSIDADIFTLGCDSLLIARVAARVSSAYGIALPVQELFQDPTIAGIATVVGVHQREGGAPAAKPWTFEQLAAEAELDPSITAAGLPQVTPGQEQTAFITGATGYLGVFILERLLRTTTLDCVCLVRGADRDDGLRRIKETMVHYRIWDDGFANRIHAVTGDIAKPRLGLSAGEFAALAERVDAIYHCAALVNFVYPYSALRAPNVLGTLEVIKLASTAKAKVVHYTSTIDVLLGAHLERPFFETDEVLQNPRGIPDGYARTKWVSEKMFANARSRGIHSCIYRPGLIMGHTTTGAVQTNDYMLIGLKGFLELGMLNEPGIMIDFIPVDFAAASIVHLSRQPESIDRYFHIWNPAPVHMAKAYDWIRSFGYRFEVVPQNTLREKVLKDVDVGSVLYPFVPVYRAMRAQPLPSSHSPSVLERINPFDESRNTFQALNQAGIECPALTETMAHRCFSFLVSIGFLPPPGESSMAS